MGNIKELTLLNLTFSRICVRSPEMLLFWNNQLISKKTLKFQTDDYQYVTFNTAFACFPEGQEKREKQ